MNTPLGLYGLLENTLQTRLSENVLRDKPVYHEFKTFFTLKCITSIGKMSEVKMKIKIGYNYLHLTDKKKLKISSYQII